MSLSMNQAPKVIHFHFAKMDSTNNWAKAHAHEFDFEALSIITASEQTHGRGRLERHWHSPPNCNLYVSLCFFVDEYKPFLESLSLFTGLIVCYTLEELQFAPQVKWPNDILLHQKKVSGILCETTPIQNKLCIVCGIGLNINMTDEECQKVDQPATSLLIERQKEYSTLSILELLKQPFLRHLPIFLLSGFAIFSEKLKQRLFST